MIFCALATAPVFFVCRGFIRSKQQVKNEATENFLHREMHIAFVTVLILLKQMFCHRIVNELNEPLSTGEIITGALIELGISIAVFFIGYQVLTFLLIKREDDEGRAVMAYYFVIIALALKEIAPGLAILLAEI